MMKNKWLYSLRLNIFYYDEIDFLLLPLNNVRTKNKFYRTALER